VHSLVIMRTLVCAQGPTLMPRKESPFKFFGMLATLQIWNMSPVCRGARVETCGRQTFVNDKASQFLRAGFGDRPEAVIASRKPLDLRGER